MDAKAIARQWATGKEPLKESTPEENTHRYLISIYSDMAKTTASVRLQAAI